MEKSVKFRKKPVVVDVVRFLPDHEATQQDRLDLLELTKGHGIQIYADCILIPTLEGTMKALPGDWIIKGVKGELYPCKPDIFDATYERVID